MNRRKMKIGSISQKTLNLNFYYAFNYCKSSFPAAFSQSYIQKRSAGSWMIGASFDGSKTKVKGMTIRLNELALGAGYGYNLVPSAKVLKRNGRQLEAVFFMFLCKSR